MRIEFLSLTLAQPNAVGSCVSDALTVSGAATIIPPICGENSGQHIYLNFKGDEEIRISIDTSAAPMARSWKLKISQIGCDSVNRGKLKNILYTPELISYIIQHRLVA